MYGEEDEENTERTISKLGVDFLNYKSNFEIVKKIFKEADDTLNFSISKLILEGPKEELDLTADNNSTRLSIFTDYSA